MDTTFDGGEPEWLHRLYHHLARIAILLFLKIHFQSSSCLHVNHFLLPLPFSGPSFRIISSCWPFPPSGQLLFLPSKECSTAAIPEMPLSMSALNAIAINRSLLPVSPDSAPPAAPYTTSSVPLPWLSICLASITVISFLPSPTLSGITSSKTVLFSISCFRLPMKLFPVSSPPSILN